MSTAIHENSEERPGVSEAVVRVRRLNHFFGDGDTRKQALSGVNLEVGPGQIIIMTGPSGSGKTTLLTLLGALRTVQDGAVEVLGRPLAGLPPQELVRVRRDIGFIFQDHNLFASLTALQNVKMAVELRHHNPLQVHRRAVKALQEVGLGDCLHDKPGKLSGGMKQRVAIARALANGPKLVLADEPTAALDEANGRDVVNLLQRLARERGCTSLIVTHDNRILDVADRIVSMVNGRIKSDVSVKEHFEICEFLRGCDLFARLTPAQLTNVAEKVGREWYAPGTAIIRQGDEPRKFYVIQQGAVDVVIDHGLPTAEHRGVLGQGQYFGEKAIVEERARTATVVARDEVRLLTLGKDDFKAALAASESFYKEVEKVLFQRQ
jgi:putative ABC transport system ATP-binding protein